MEEKEDKVAEKQAQAAELRRLMAAAGVNSGDLAFLFGIRRDTVHQACRAKRFAPPPLFRVLRLLASDPLSTPLLFDVYREAPEDVEDAGLLAPSSISAAIVREAVRIIEAFKGAKPPRAERWTTSGTPLHRVMARFVGAMRRVAIACVHQLPPPPVTTP